MSLRKREQLEQMIAEIARQETEKFEEQVGNTSSLSETNPKFGS